MKASNKTSLNLAGNTILTCMLQDVSISALDGIFVIVLTFFELYL